MVDENVEKREVSEEKPDKNSGNILWKYRTEIVIALSTTCIMAGAYFQSFGLIKPKYFNFLIQNPDLFRKSIAFSRVPLPQLIFFLAIPVISLLLMREPLRKYGFRVGDWKIGLKYAALSILILAPFLYWASTMPGFKGYYGNRAFLGFGFMVLQYMLYMFSWEFILRGYIYFSLEERVGPLAIWLQSVPFAIAHLGKPAPEALTCFFGGLVLGYISMKTRSFFYAFLVHWGIYVTLLTFVLMNQ